ncbi:cyclin-dependent kinase inhibitor 1Ba [Ictalurus punctatus]|uniref:Cyclin-dependent kinase inhibitor 1B n=1 Tax=Ictalurus punctatus TaxID=7998 RepID=A0A2D0T5U4_ICTPU|nr:cyclin-dependent kinase inhibitor 1Ba [Ictalurus punctatus]
MSDVRLSNGSPPLERVDARPEGHTKPSVCRNLFGSPHPGEVRQAYLDELRESEAAYREKYNYDFVKDMPLEPGRYVWEPVDARDAPEVYSRPPRATKRVDLNASQTDCQKTQSAGKKRPSLEDADSARQSKRVNHGEEDSSSQDSAEQTPRKSDPST